jgi:hypothetical protein
MKFNFRIWLAELDSVAHEVYDYLDKATFVSKKLSEVPLLIGVTGGCL